MWWCVTTPALARSLAFVAFTCKTSPADTESKWLPCLVISDSAESFSSPLINVVSLGHPPSALTNAFMHTVGGQWAAGTAWDTVWGVLKLPPGALLQQSAKRVVVRAAGSSELPLWFYTGSQNWFYTAPRLQPAHCLTPADNSLGTPTHAGVHDSSAVRVCTGRALLLPSLRPKGRREFHTHNCERSYATAHRTRFILSKPFLLENNLRKQLRMPPEKHH